MKNSILTHALKVSMESDEDSQELLDQLRDEGGPVTADSYAEDRQELESDIEILSEAEESIVGDTISQESLDSAVRVVKAITGRYHMQLETASMESFDTTVQRDAVVEQIRGMRTSMESAMVVAMESYHVSDLWDKIGLLNREVPNLRDSLSVLKNYSGGNSKLAVTPMFGRSLVYALRVDGSVPDNIAKAAGDTGDIISDLIKFGTKLVDDAKKAGDIACRTDWKDHDAASKAMGQINQIKPQVDETYRRFDEVFTMGNRRLNVKKFDIKGLEGMGNWSHGASLNVSWPKVTAMDLIFTAGTVQVVEGARKRNIKIDDMIAGLEKLVAAATATQQMRSNSPKKWQEHNTLKKRMGKDVVGSAEVKAVKRTISETSRLGWQCLNGSVTVLYYIIREINEAAGRITKQARKNAN